MPQPLHTVHVRVNDAATGQPTPVRIRFTDSEGTYYAPFGRLTEFATGCGEDVGGNLQIGSQKYAYIDGTCEILLPASGCIVEVSKGPEYKPIRQEVMLGPGKMALRLTIERWSDARKDGWYSGDTRAHHLTPHASLLEGAAEDLAVVNLLADETTILGTLDPVDDEATRRFPAISNILAFSGQRPALEESGHLVVVGTWNGHLQLGTLALLNCHRIVFPLKFGGPGGFEDWTLADWCDQCHRKGGLAVWTKSKSLKDSRLWLKDSKFHCGEALADLILGKIDALEIRAAIQIADWHLLLNCGLCVPIVGGSGKFDNTAALGWPRTYAQLLPGQEFDYRNWIEAIRAGRTFVTTGPLLFLTVNGQGPGSVINASSGRAKVHVRVEVKNAGPLEMLQIVGNGPNRSINLRGKATGVEVESSAIFEEEIELPTGWIAAAVYLGEKLGLASVFAHTSPVYIQVEGQKPKPAPQAIETVMKQLDRALAWVQLEGRFQNQEQRERLSKIFWSARDALMSRARS